MQEVPTQGGPAELVEALEPHRKALQLHCYRMVGSLHDAEDLVQETMLRAWKSYGNFKGGSSLRTWLHRIATNACLDALKKRRQPRRLRPAGPASDPRLPVGAPTGEADWLEPYPDSELPSAAETPEEGSLRRETVSLAFCAALQLLTPRQRAVLILGDVLDWRASEIGVLLGMSVSAVDSALHRSRQALARRGVSSTSNSRELSPGREIAQPLLDRYLAAWHSDDVEGLVELLRSDAVLAMPPFPAWFEGKEAVGTILSLHPFGFGRRAGWRLTPTCANGQPAFVLHRADEPGGAFKAFGIVVLTLAASPGGICIGELTVYKNEQLVERFGLPGEIVRPGSA